MDLNFNRTLSHRLAVYLAKFRFISPNVVTTLGLFTATLAAVCALDGSRSGLLALAFWMHATFILDSADGELARLTDRRSAFGHWYDVFSDVIKDALIWTGLFWGAAMHNAGEGPGAALAAACAGSLLNFGLVVWERGRGCSFHPADTKGAKGPLFFRALDSLSHNGGSILLVWLAAFAGDAFLLLAGAAVFLNFVACVRFFSNFKRLTGAPLLGTFGKIAGLALGVGLLWASVQGISWTELRSLFLAQGLPLLVPALLVFPAACLFHALGFHRLFSRPVRSSVPLSTVYMACLAGDSVNKITPFADVGGEPLKAWWVSRSASGSESLAATYLSKLMFVLAEGMFIVCGVLAVAAMKPSGPLVALGIAGATLTFVFFGLLAFFPRRILNWMKQPVAGETETLIGEAWKNRRHDMLISFGWNFVGCALLFLEIHLALRILGLNVSVTDSLLIQTLLRGIQSATFFIPAQIGSQESGLMYLLTHFHFPSIHGLAVSLLRRLRQVAWGLAASVLFFAFARLTLAARRI